ncbi:hypothetical protein AKG39_04115 [Acetobacterium bakii]|uniref:Calcineurin-like phosphoesterase domain-containing protein n=1 Tax=Acetobacterium bakii TaxID=52689 RepID=A0A0L6U3V6_9FIRM|nr:hypothetical protein AKG39_04115 [Acetobacterium bakii]
MEPNLLKVNRVKLESDKPETLIKIVFFGDTHFGEFYDTSQLDRIVEKVNAENPDIVIFTGDLIGASGEFISNPDCISLGLAEIHATYGKYGVFGNHEYALYQEYDYEETMKAGGFEVLVNDWVDIPEINVRILGIDDYYQGSPDKDLGSEARMDAFNILITHEPDFVDQMNIDGVQLILAGHTHGGQISIPFLTEKILPFGGEKYIKGLFEIGMDGKTDLFVTKGIGTTKLPFRFMNIPEIVSIEIGN